MVWLKWLMLETIHGVYVNCSYQPASVDLTESSVPCFFSIFKIKIFISLLLVVLIVLLEISLHGYLWSFVFWLGSKAPTSGPRLRIFKGWQKSDSFWCLNRLEEEEILWKFARSREAPGNSPLLKIFLGQQMESNVQDRRNGGQRNMSQVNFRNVEH